MAAVISSALLTLPLLPSSALAQLGYADLLAEQGSQLAPTSGSRLVYIPEQSAGWRYWTGDLGAPAADWRLSSYAEPSGWLSGQTSVGYADGDDNTILLGMKDNYGTIYLRHQFTIAPGALPSMLHLRLYVDDGAIVWLNGTEIGRANVTTPNPGASSLATSTVGDARWHDFFIPGTGDLVVEGSNTVSVHALNGSLGSSDFSIDLELARPRLGFGQVEARSSNNFLPDATPVPTPAVGYEFQGAGAFNHKIFEVRSASSELGFGTSIHAANVATFCYRYPNSAGFFLSHIKAWEAKDFLGAGLLRSGSTPPDPSFTQVQNHSWIATTADFPSSELNNMIRRFDYMAGRDGILYAVGLNNGSSTAVPEIWGCSYNSIVVGRTDGIHSRGGTVIGIDGAGRMKPDVVAPGNGNATSYSTGNVSGTAALLLGHAYEHPELSQVFHPAVNKAIIMAGATKEAGWANTSSQPLDPVFGAGTVNILDSFHLLTAGQHAAGGSVPASGWDYSKPDPAGAASYTFAIPEDEVAKTCSIVLTWFRQFEDSPAANDFGTLPILADFELRLYESVGGTPGSLLAISDSPIDNVEHVYLEGLPAGEYTITIQSDEADSPYAIAWDNRLSGLPQVAIGGIDPISGDVSVSLENLVSGTAYTLQYSDDLSNWANLYTVTAAREVEPFTQTAVPTNSRAGFYRIIWTP
jgi:hypothetical protein